MEEKSVGRSFLILSIAGILIKILSAAYMPFLKAILDWEGYGIYAASYNWFIFIFAITTMGAQPAVTKVVTELRTLGYQKDALKAMKIAKRYLLIVGLIFTALFMFLAEPIANLTKSPESALSIKFLAPTIVITAVLSAYRGYLQGIEDMKTLALSQVIEQCINVILSLIFAFLLVKINLVWGSAGGTVGTSIGALVALLFILYIYNRNGYEEEAVTNDKKIKSISNKTIIRKLIKYGLPITLVAGMQNAGGVIDTINVQSRLLSAGFPDSQAKALFGILTSYNTLLYVPLAIVTALSTAIFPRIIQAYTEKNRKELKSQISYSFRLTYLITIPAAVGLTMLSKEIYYTVFGGYDGYELLKYGSIVLVLMSITSIQNTVLQGVNKLYLVLMTASIGIAIKFAINYLLVGIREINILGAVVASVFAFLVPAMINHKKIERIFKMKVPVIRQAIMPLISSIMMGFGVVVCKSILLRVVNIFEGGRVAIAIVTLISIGIGGIVYGIAMIYTGGLTKKDVELISPRIYEMLPRTLRKKMKV